jgi:hypothetical protein
LEWQDELNGSDVRFRDNTDRSCDDCVGYSSGNLQETFGFEKWPDFDENLFAEIYNAEYEKEFDGKIFGSEK